MGSFVFGFSDVDRMKVEAVGGKGANLAELAKMEGLHVPGGFCIATNAFKRIMEHTPLINALVEQLSLMKADERAKISELSAELRRLIEGVPIPADITEEIAEYLAKFGDRDAYAVRSSATAEDLPAASFAGQQDTYLNIVGKEAILLHVSKCWASLFTDRAVTYRIQNGFDHRKVQLSVVVQQMVFPQVAGVLFTADPVAGNRKVSLIEASYGLGEAMVAGRVNADNYRVINGKIIDKKIAAKKLAIYALTGGGTKEEAIAPEQQDTQALTDKQIVQLAQIGRKIEAHFGSPQDVEWCLAGDIFYIVQSRPITTLYPVPVVADEDNHVYISVGHQQMMTDAMKPLGLSLFQLTAVRPMLAAGGRLFVDVAKNLASPATRSMLIDAMEKFEPLIKDALTTIAAREGFIQLPQDGNNAKDDTKIKELTVPAGPSTQVESDPAIVAELIRGNEQSLEVLKANIQTKSGVEIFDFILEDLRLLKTILSDPKGMPVIMAAINATTWINEKMAEWLGEKNAADILSLSVPNNITSEMGLALADVADVIRPYPHVIAYLQHAGTHGLLDGLDGLEGGQQAQEAINAFLDRYGMRCIGEIDMTRPRWSEQPAALVPLMLSNINNLAPGYSQRQFEQGQKEALAKEHDLLARLVRLPDGTQKAEETRKAISIMRNFIGYREYPKYSMVSRYFVYRMALLKEAERLEVAKIIHEKEDVYYWAFDEFREAVRTREVDYGVINSRKEEHRRYEKLSPPRVMTSDGEVVTGKYNRDDLPAGALAGLAVSSGVIEGRARVILNMEDADIEEGDILVTTFTDPSWTPLFVSIKGLVTEVGGLMTHGAVVAREYGLPAVVGVESATKLIKDGQRIRVNGTDGYVEIINEFFDHA